MATASALGIQIAAIGPSILEMTMLVAANALNTSAPINAIQTLRTSLFLTPLISTICAVSCRIDFPFVINYRKDEGYSGGSAKRIVLRWLDLREILHNQGYLKRRRKPKVSTILLIILLHIAALYGLARAFAPDMTAIAQDAVVSAFTVTVTAPPEDPPPEAEPAPDEGAAGAAGEKAVPKPVTAPTPKVPVKQDVPLPEASSDGLDNTSGAQDDGTGTGAAGDGIGTGSGRDGGGAGTAIARKPELIATITDAGAFPVPPGGREARVGHSVIVRLTVSAQGRPTACRIYRPSPFPATDQAVCDLALQQVRFRPALNNQGDPVAAPFYYKQEFFD